MRKINILVMILVLSFIAITFVGCADNDAVNADPVSETEETMTEEANTIIDDTEEEYTNEQTTELTTITTTEEDKGPEIKKVEGKIIAGELSFIGSNVLYSYVAPITGMYRFDFDINNVNYDYKFTLCTLKDEVLRESSYSDGDHGVSARLEKGTEYIIKIEQEEDTPEYSINIGIPHESKVVNGNKISGDLDFINQSDEYLFTPTVTGIYRFDFDTDNVNENYQFAIYDKKQQNLAEENYDNGSNGVTRELEKGETYYIYVSQKEGYPHYEISIGIPKKVKTVEDGVFSGNLKYEDQVDRYRYTISKGSHKITFSNVDASTEIRFEILSSNNKEIFSSSQTEDPIEFEVEENDNYKIFVEQYDGFTKYKIKIS